jgi:hypothetical protein
MARPLINPQLRKDTPLMLMLTAEQKAIIQRAAEAEGLGMSAWVRMVTLRAAGADNANQRREGVTIPSAQKRTPPAGYKAAAPPRREPLSRQKKSVAIDDT